MISKPKKEMSFGQKVRLAQLSRRIWNLQEDLKDEWSIAKANGYTRGEFESDDEINDMIQEKKMCEKKYKKISKNPNTHF